MAVSGAQSPVLSEVRPLRTVAPRDAPRWKYGPDTAPSSSTSSGTAPGPTMSLPAVVLRTAADGPGDVMPRGRGLPARGQLSSPAVLLAEGVRARSNLPAVRLPGWFGRARCRVGGAGTGQASPARVWSWAAGAARAEKPPGASGCDALDRAVRTRSFPGPWSDWRFSAVRRRDRSRVRPRRWCPGHVRTSPCPSTRRTSPCPS